MESSIFTVEARAIDPALKNISKSKHMKFIFKDSLSQIQNPLIIKLLKKSNTMSNKKEIMICRTPSHIGVRENERDDSAAKSA